MQTPKFKVAIIGGGIGGLTCAVALGKGTDVEVDIYEAAPAFAEIGAGLSLWPRAWKVLQNLGLADDLATSAMQPLNDEPRITFQCRKSDEPEGIGFYDIVTTGSLVPFHRAGLQQSLVKHLSSSCRCHFSKRLASYTESNLGQISLKFQDGSSAACDVLVGADGIRSAVRGSLRQHQVNDLGQGPCKDTVESLTSADIAWSGTVVYRGLIPRDLLQTRAPNYKISPHLTLYSGADKHLVVYPISQGQLINVAAFCSDPMAEGVPYNGKWVVDVPDNELAENFSGWEEEVQLLLQSIEKPTRWAIHALKPLDTYVFRRIALLGDAAHAMTPHQGSGAGQAIEDAYILATLISAPECTLENIPSVLQVYDHIRRPRSSRIQEGSRLTGKLFDLLDARLADLDLLDNEKESTAKSNAILSRLPALYEKVQEQWSEAWITTAENDKQRALDMLHQVALEEPTRGCGMEVLHNAGYDGPVWISKM